MKVVYIAGPFRAPNSWEIEQNIRRAENLALEVWMLTKNGESLASAICPHANTRFFQGYGPDEIWLRGDLEIVLRCDALLLVEGWERSEGTLKEIEFARDNNIPVFNTLENLYAWITNEKL